MGFKSLSLSLLSVLVIGNIAHANESEASSPVQMNFNRLNSIQQSLASSSNSSSSPHPNQLTPQQPVSSQAKNTSRSEQLKTTVLQSIYIRDNTLWVYTSGNDAIISVNTQKEAGKVYLTLNETLLDRKFNVYPQSTFTDVLLESVEVNQISTEPAVIEIAIKTDQKNWQVVTRQGGFSVTQVPTPPTPHTQASIQNSRIQPQSSFTMKEPLLASATTETQNHEFSKINVTQAVVETEQTISSVVMEATTTAEKTSQVQTSMTEVAQTRTEELPQVPPENTVENSSPASVAPEPAEQTREENVESIPQPAPQVSSPEITTPLYRQPIRLLHLNTANQLKAGESMASFSETQTISGGKGTGNQTYYTYSDWGLTDDLQVGWAWMLNDDPTYNRVNGEFIDQQYQSMGPNIKYRFYQDENWSLAILGALEYFQIYSGPGLYNNQQSPTVSNTIAGSIQVPITYNLSEQLQATITPGVNIFSNNLNGVPFFGTIFNVGAGLSWQILPEFSVYANTVVPFGSGNNAVSPSREFFQKVLWAVGGTYAYNKAIAIELHLTNSFGGTPTTGILPLPTASNEILLGGSFIMVPSAKEKREDIVLSDRNQKLLFDWFTLTTPYILPTDDFGFRVAGDSEGSIGGRVFYSFLQDYQIEFAIASIGGFDTSTVIETRLGTDTQWRAGGKLVLLNQLDGDPFSISGRLTFGRDWGNKQGYMMVEFPMMYEINPQWAVLFSPKAAINGGNTPVGIGLGANYQLNSFTQLIAEVTPLVTGERTVWSAGVRFFPIPNLSIDLLGTNSTSQFDLGTVIAEPGTRFSMGLQWRN